MDRNERRTSDRRTAAWAAVLLAAFSSLSPLAAEDAGPAVVSFKGRLVLEVDGRKVRLKPGSSAYTVPAGAKVEVRRGSAEFGTEEAVLRADRGDSFTYTVEEGEAYVQVHEGALLVAPAGGKAVEVRAGQHVPVLAPALPPGIESVRPEKTAPEEPPAPEARPEPWNPMTALAEPELAPDAAPHAIVPLVEEKPPAEPRPRPLRRALGRLKGLKKPKLDLVLKLRPFYTVTQAYDSNIYLVPPDKSDGTRVGGGVVGSWVTAQDFGSLLELPLSRRRRIEGLADLKWTSYSKQPSANNALDLALGADYRAEPRRGVTQHLWEKYRNTEDPAFSELVARQRRIENEAGIRIDRTRSRRFVVSPEATHVRRHYLDPSLAGLLDRIELSFGADLGVLVQPRTRVYAAYRRELLHYSAGRGDHSKSHRVGLGVDGRLAPKLTGKAQADMQLRHYDRAPSGGSRDVETFLADVSLDWKPIRRGKLRLRLYRNIEETTFSGNRHYVAAGFTLGAEHLYRKLTLSADIGFQTDRYPEASSLGGLTANRRDDLYQAGVSLDYRVRKWLTASLAYRRLQRCSNFSGQFDYEADRTSLKLDLRY